MQETLHNYPNLAIRAGSVFDLVFDRSDPSSSSSWGKVVGVKLGALFYVTFRCPTETSTMSIDSGEIITCSQVVICTGTFLSGEIHIGTYLSIPLFVLL